MKFKQEIIDAGDDFLGRIRSNARKDLIGIIGIILSLVGMLNSQKIQITIQSSPLFIISLLILIIAIIILLKKPNIRFFSDRNKVPKNFLPNNLLEYMLRKKLNLTVIGRTNTSWFENMEGKGGKKELYKKALKNGCKIKFIIQHKFVENINIKDVKRIEKIKKEHDSTIRNFKKIYEALKEENYSIDDNFNLLLTSVPINNSMTALHKNDDFAHFSYDIGLNIDKNPYLVFLNNSIIPELKDKFYESEKNCIDIFKYEERYNDGKNKINGLIKKYSQFSCQRDNQNKKLAYHYFERKKHLLKNEFYPPVTIQLLITNKCNTECVMCDHHSINYDNELSETEIMRVIDYIQDIGTKNIIISGGEPLSRSDCIRILEYAKRKGLNIGLFTNGVKNNSESITTDEAKQIKEYCDWVQLSIDSFEETTYKQIRKNDLSIVKESLENLEAVGVNLEIVFTIQKLNIDEAVQMVKTGKTVFGFRSKVRFKFAHGPDNNNKFLLINEGDKFDEFIKNSVNEANFYSKYFNEMIEKEYFTRDDILNGKPLYIKNGKFKENGYICHAIYYFCMINSEGDIYPCCFLYDDNNGENSNIRKKHFHGSLRSNGVIPPLSANENRLKEELKNLYKDIDNKKIPVDKEACNYCTRHFYQNALLNELDKSITEFDKKYTDYNFDNLYTHDEGNSKIWL